MAPIIGTTINYFLNMVGYQLTRYQASQPLLNTSGSPARPSFQDALPPTNSANKVILLNDTDALEGYCHFGSETVTQTIIEQLARRGVDVVATVNSPRDIERIACQIKDEWVNAIVLNGEGTLHSGNLERAKWLLEAAQMLKRKNGGKLILLNAIWDLPVEYTCALDAFDYVSVRDGQSRELLLNSGINAVAHPDISLLGFQSYSGHQPKELPAGPGYFVLDSVRTDVSIGLMSHAAMVGAPYFFCSKYNIDCYQATVGPRFFVDTQLFPKLFRLSDLRHLPPRLITGRFHGMCLAVALGLPFLVSRSNSHKIEAMIKDMDLPLDLMIPESWLLSPTPDLTKRIEELWQLWNEPMIERLITYCSTASDEIGEMFDEISMLTSLDMTSDGPNN